MTSKRKSPPAATGRASGRLELETFDVQKITDTSREIQQIRAAWLMRRCAVNPDLALLIAQIALGEVRA
jgi:hypothetical protein